MHIQRCLREHREVSSITGARDIRAEPLAEQTPPAAPK
jgi:hypothetical protein